MNDLEKSTYPSGWVNQFTLWSMVLQIPKPWYGQFVPAFLVKCGGAEFTKHIPGLATFPCIQSNNNLPTLYHFPHQYHHCDLLSLHTHYALSNNILRCCCSSFCISPSFPFPQTRRSNMSIPSYLHSCRVPICRTNMGYCNANCN